MGLKFKQKKKKNKLYGILVQLLVQKNNVESSNCKTIAVVHKEKNKTHYVL